MYLFDTCTCIEFLKGRLPETLGVLQHSNPSDFALSSVTLSELLVGAEKSSNPEKSRRQVIMFCKPYEVLPFDGKCAELYAGIRVHLEREGLKIGPYDMQIAAVALANGATLVTNNVREFQRVPLLHVESWEEIDF